VWYTPPVWLPFSESSQQLSKFCMRFSPLSVSFHPACFCRLITACFCLFRWPVYGLWFSWFCSRLRLSSLRLVLVQTQPPTLLIEIKILGGLFIKKHVNLKRTCWCLIRVFVSVSVCVLAVCSCSVYLTSCCCCFQCAYYCARFNI